MAAKRPISWTVTAMSFINQVKLGKTIELCGESVFEEPCLGLEDKTLMIRGVLCGLFRVLDCDTDYAAERRTNAYVAAGARCCSVETTVSNGCYA